MKRKLVVLTLAMTIAAGIFTGCGQKAEKQENTQQTEVVDQKMDSDQTMDDSEKEAEENPELAKLVQEENQILEEHSEIWDKVFAKVDNVETAEKMNQGQSYIEFLKESVEKAQVDLSDDEKAVIQKDLSKIEQFEKQISELEAKGEK